MILKIECEEPLHCFASLRMSIVRRWFRVVEPPVSGHLDCEASLSGHRLVPSSLTSLVSFPLSGKSSCSLSLVCQCLTKSRVFVPVLMLLKCERKGRVGRRDDRIPYGTYYMKWPYVGSASAGQYRLQDPAPQIYSIRHPITLIRSPLLCR